MHIDKEQIDVNSVNFLKVLHEEYFFDHTSRMLVITMTNDLPHEIEAKCQSFHRYLWRKLCGKPRKRSLFSYMELNNEKNPNEKKKSNTHTEKPIGYQFTPILGPPGSGVVVR